MKYIQFALIPLLLLFLSHPVAALRPQYSTGSLGSGTGSSAATNAVTVAFLTNGTIQMRLNNQLVGSGIPQMLNIPPTLTTGVAISATHGQVTEQYSQYNITITYDCVLTGTDLSVSALVQNNGTAATSALSFLMPTFTFSGIPTGTMPSWHSTYLTAEGPGLFHPSSSCPLGCVFAGDSNYAVAAWSPSEVSAPSLIQASWASNNNLPNPLPLELHTMRVVPPGTSTTVSIVIRVTTDQSPTGIQSGYKLLLPAMSYTPVQQQSIRFQGIAAIWVTPSNPYGYDGGFRRLDWPQGCQQYVVAVNPMLQAVNGLGVIFWAPGGYQTTTMYPVDYDINLSRIATTWPILVNAMQNDGYRVGIAARFGDALNPDGSIYRADPTNPADIAAMITRIQYCAATGVDLWYVDSACDDWNSTQMTAIAKSYLPASHLFFTEFSTDVSLAFAGAYCEWDGTQTHWLSEVQRAHLQVLYPNAMWYCADQTNTLTTAQMTAMGLIPFSPD